MSYCVLFKIVEKINLLRFELKKVKVLFIDNSINEIGLHRNTTAFSEMSLQGAFGNKAIMEITRKQFLDHHHQDGWNCKLKCLVSFETRPLIESFLVERHSDCKTDCHFH